MGGVLAIFILGILIAYVRDASTWKSRYTLAIPFIYWFFSFIICFIIFSVSVGNDLSDLMSAFVAVLIYLVFSVAVLSYLWFEFNKTKPDLFEKYGKGIGLTILSVSICIILFLVGLIGH